MGKLYSFSKSDTADVAFSNAVSRCNLVLREVIALLDEEIGTPQQSVQIIAWMSAACEKGELLAKDTIPLIFCTDEMERMVTSQDEVFEDFVGFIRQLPPAFRLKILEGLANGLKSPQDAPEGEQ